MSLWGVRYAALQVACQHPPLMSGACVQVVGDESKGLRKQHKHTGYVGEDTISYRSTKVRKTPQRLLPLNFTWSLVDPPSLMFVVPHDS